MQEELFLNQLKIRMQQINLNSQFVRFILTGLLSNVLGYGFFLVSVYIIGLGHKTSATILFLIGMLVNYIVNKNWTFALHGKHISTLSKFSITYFVGYFLNISMLFLFVDKLSYSPGWVQLFAIGILVIYYFFLNKYFIFKR